MANFLIAAEKDIELTGKMTVNLNDYIEETIENMNDIQNYCDEYGLEEEDDAIQNMIQAIEAGRVVHVVPVEEDDTTKISAYLAWCGIEVVDWDDDSIEPLRGDAY